MNLTGQQKTMVAVLLAGALLAVLNQTMLTPALPSIMGHLNVNTTTVQWLTSAYSLVEAVVIPLNAFLLGRFPSRRLFIGGIGIFGVGSLICAVAPSFAFLLLGRICQAIATGIAMPTVFTLILLIFPREHRGSAMGIIGLIISFAPAVGPSLSGILVDGVGWRALFVIDACLACAVVILAVVALKNFEGFEPTALDVLSVILLAAGMVSLLYGISISTSSATVALPIALIVAGVAVLGLFAWRQLRLDVPILQIGVLKTREFRIAVIAIMFLEAALVGSGVILPLYIQNALGATATMSGLLMLPGAVCGALVGLLAGRLFDRHGVRVVTLAGAGVLVVGGIGYVLLGIDSPLLAVGAVYTVACIGLQALITPVNTWGLNSLPNRAMPHGNAILSTIEQVGISLGTAFVTSLTALSYLAAPADATPAEQSFAGCHIAFFGLLGIIVVLALIIALFVRTTHAQQRERERAAAERAAAPGVPGVDRPLLVSDVMNPAPAVLGEHATVREAIALLQRTETSGLPLVADDGTVKGFLSDGDVLQHLASENLSRSEGDAYVVLFDAESLKDRLGKVLDHEAMELATKRVISVNADDTAQDAFRALSEKRIKKMPVLRDGKLAGTISRGNAMRAIAVLEGAPSQTAAASEQG